MLRSRLAWLMLALSAESWAVSDSSSLNIPASCFSRYEAFLNASGTPVVTSIVETDTFFSFSGTNFSSLATETGTITFTTTLVPTPYTPPPECFTGCVIDADRVQLIYWPTPKPNATQTGAPSEITNSPAAAPSVVVDGSTLVSPSNYLVFTNLVAQACPLDNSPCTTIGTPVALTTLAFGQNELSSELCQHVFSSINYADFNTPIPWSVVSTQPGCTLILTETHDPASPAFGFTLNPNIMFPDEVRTAIDPLWTSCSFVTAAYDPPTALTPVPPPTPTPSSPAASSTPPAQSSPAEPPAQSSSAAPPAQSTPAPPPAESSPATSPNPPAESNPPVESIPPPGASLPNTPVDTPAGGPTGVNNNGNPPTPSQNAGSGSGNDGGNTGSPLPPDGSGSGSGSGTGSGSGSGNGSDSGTGSGSGSGSNTAVGPNDPAVTPGESSPSGAELPSSVTVSMITILTTSGAVAGSGSETANVGDSTSVIAGDGDGGSTNGISTAASTVIVSEAGVVLRGLAVAKSIAIAALFAVLI